MGSVAKNGLQQYLIQLQQHPLRTKVITAGVLSAITDIVAQKLSGIQKLQLRRLLLKVYICRLSILGILEFLSTLGKAFVPNQAPMFITLMYGRPWIHVKSKIKKEYPTVQYTAWTFWPVVGWVNHQYVPLQFRVVVQSLVGCFWAISESKQDPKVKLSCNRTTGGMFELQTTPLLNLSCFSTNIVTLSFGYISLWDF
ncbi:UNVERIFIED_CONTAM: Peroxisomal membrane protein PMP22 [Sesamum radiatum]|uniref:Peroxisomal membrane protein PMP22 n=1 Tax=Sesamum radiatum TaxID=300843 RepID=A0AAW2LQA8_SESRA